MLEKLEKDNEKLAHSDSEPDLGEAAAQHKTHDAYVPSSSEREEEQRLDKMKADALKREKKSVKTMKKMEKDFDKQHELKKQMKELRKQSKKALRAAQQSTPELGDSLSLKKAAIDAKIKDAAKKVKAAYDKIDATFAKHHNAESSMQDQLTHIKNDALASADVTDDDPSSQLGESSANLQDEMDDLGALTKTATKTIDSDWMRDAVKSANKALDEFKASSLQVLDTIH